MAFINKLLGKRNRALVALLLSLTVIMSACLISLSFCEQQNSAPLTKEEITANLSEMRDKGYGYACNYLHEIGITGFSEIDFKIVETLFSVYSVLDLPDTFTLAKNTAQLYLDEVYDNIDNTDSDTLTSYLIKCYVSSTSDRYAEYMTKDEYDVYREDMSGDFIGIGIHFTVNYTDKTATVTSVIRNSPAEANGILPNDRIVKVNDSDFNSDIDAMVDAIRGEEGTVVKLTVLRGEEELDFFIVRELIADSTVDYEMLEGGIGYIRIRSFKDNTDEAFMQAIDELEAMDVRGFIFDVRNNPGGYLSSVKNVLDYLVPHGTRIYSYSTSTMLKEQVAEASNLHHITVPVAVICNSGTASAGELFTSAIRDYGMAEGELGLLDEIIIGETTYGKGVMQSTYSTNTVLGGRLKLTMAYYNPPSNVNYDGKGVEPDVEIKQTNSGDAQLSEAIEQLLILINN